ncbi:MAG: SAM-dependent methyltransferase [Merdibacter sp.]
MRLKGGDPFVLGRGGEEALFLRRHGVDVTFVPGISSAIAALEAAGIPPTHRTLAFGFHVMDGHDPSRIAFDALVQDGNTYVFLMGLSHLDEIVQGLLKAGMDAQVPSAVISQGAKRGQRVLCAPLHELPQRVHAAKLCAPAIIVTGECVRLHAQLSVPRPLAGRSHRHRCIWQRTEAGRSAGSARRADHTALLCAGQLLLGRAGCALPGCV